MCRSRSSRYGRFGCWGTIPQPGWPWGEAGSSCKLTLSWPPPLRPPSTGMIRFLRLIAAFRFRSCRVAQLGQVHIRSRFRLAFTVPAGAAGPAAGEPHGGEDHPGVPPLALSVLIACQHSISAPPGAGLGFPRERPPTPGTRGRRAMTPATLISKATIRSGIRIPFRWRRVAGPVSPSLSGNGQSRPVTEHRPPAWGQHGVLYNNQKLMTAFPFRSCWVPHGARDSVFNIGLSDLKAWPVLPSGEDNRGVAP